MIHKRILVNTGEPEDGLCPVEPIKDNGELWEDQPGDSFDPDTAELYVHHQAIGVPQLIALGWRSMDTAPKDREIMVITDAVPGAEEVRLPPIITKCQWHPDAGFCVDELRAPIAWREIDASTNKHGI